MKTAGDSSCKRRGCPKLAVAVLAVLILGTVPRSLHAQVFIASQPHPEFWIAPLFITATVRSQDLTQDPGRLMLTVSWMTARPWPRRWGSGGGAARWMTIPGRTTGGAAMTTWGGVPIGAGTTIPLRDPGGGGTKHPTCTPRGMGSPR